MANDDVLRVLSRYAPADGWTDTGHGYMYRVWSVRIEAGMAWVRRDLPTHAYIVVTGNVYDLDAMMVRAERMARWDAMRWDAMKVGDGNE